MAAATAPAARCAIAASVEALARSGSGTSANARVFVDVKFIERVVPAKNSTAQMATRGQSRDKKPLARMAAAQSHPFTRMTRRKSNRRRIGVVTLFIARFSSHVDEQHEPGFNRIRA